MKLIVGLGNPGKKYEKTRHNVGFMVLDYLKKNLSKYNIGSWELSKKFNAEICGCVINNEKIILAKPMTFMNHSGQSIQLIANFYNITPENIIVAHDDKDLILGQLKIQINRGHAGHNGIKSIIEHIKSQNFHRIRVGIASTNENKMKNISKFVLNKFSLFEKRNLEKMIDTATKEILNLV
ncbi:MAG: aminoacyl-tRNA hydrolase [Candidatus Magasanikbacteria bacterium RIFCSPHIGHO2_01_FULL_33_34]|uniref:Peptidyl-tRNA hydrolase n=1 Tax=Candidatus Magasanikbacteria bacterium RIFCSPHIGHO2_01_FULL_33_34 TaxID=1798671 RepID=A0A1F6LLC0_9BACT|nr:MAG: aminoacyl-tRNA hydrolase [Candidatus Magasanikbacteria bacterium RIFCSPHIGHO2_01_FULL_33_34]OGH65966.1 MAG: aminoacyl-tRNA hydrolase [Candidatus Magasanikbacteria bacterium RIFCSPHIGHO2_02_FULL_33_17]OGH76361.1 MAG: aminoacyl-tRNA hydrolase [Candidatus Magasanikbacteria bacterium RIFCSPLOWO2_01_FULL_33_34]OGH82280.1 MAG: aminoacyl-tRNA hydrolase [Candidatus Magasanikbacteria bacterium RIFCSPLOWO2_12_FULL_34_7]